MTDNKQRSFYDNILLPGSTREVTVDTHMAKAIEQSYGVAHDEALRFLALGRQTVKEDIHVQGIGYIAVSSAVQQIADDPNSPYYGEDLDTIQAAYWIAVKDAIDPIQRQDGTDWPSGQEATYGGSGRGGPGA